MSTIPHPLPSGAAPSALPTFGLPASAPVNAMPHAAATLSPETQSGLSSYALGGPKTPLAMHAPWLTHTFATIFIMSAIILIVLLAVQTTKQESLGGSMSGRAEAYRPRLGVDGQLARATEIVAIFFVISATLVSLSGI